MKLLDYVKTLFLTLFLFALMVLAFVVLAILGSVFFVLSPIILSVMAYKLVTSDGRE